MQNFQDISDLAAQMSDTQEVRVTKKVPIAEGDPPYLFGEEPANKLKLLIVDVETTGLKSEEDEVIEIAGVGMIVCADTYRVYGIQPLFSFLREPVKPISAEITDITGIKPEDVVGKQVDFSELYRRFSNADLIVAHNATFDRPFVEKLAPELADRPSRWADSLHDPDWKSLGFRKKNLTALLDHIGFYFPAHRAINDCCATAFLLAMTPAALKSVITRGLNETYRMVYSNTPYGSNEELKKFGYSYSNKTWFKYYPDTESMLEDRQEIGELLQNYPNYQRTIIKCGAISPYNRFIG